MYPYKVHVFDKELIPIFERLGQQRAIQLPDDKHISTRLTWIVRPIRNDLFIGRDNRYRRTFCALKPSMTILTKKRGNGLYVEFRKLF